MRRPPRPLLVLALSAALLTACTHSGTDPSAGTTTAPASIPHADDVLAQVAQAMSALDVSSAPLSGAPAYASQDIAEVTRGMGGLKPTVKPGTITYHAAQKTAEGELRYSWPTFPKAWEYSTNVALILVDGHWQWRYDPSAIQANLTPDSKLVATRLYAQRGTIFGGTGTALVEQHDVMNVGIDKTQVPDAAEQEASARALAKLLSMDADAYATQVKNAGAQAFVLAQVVRGTSAPADLAGIKGARGIADKAMLGPSKTFGQPLLGALGAPTQSMLEQAGGALGAGDVVGLTGIQNWHDKELRGSDGIRIDATWRSAGAQASATPGGQVFPVMLFKTDPVDGAALKLTLNPDWQTKAESALADVASPSALALVQPSSGKVLALAVSPSANGQPLANWSKYPPGSTFKIVSTLALLRAGLTPDSPVECPTSVNVNGQEIHNYPGYPAEHNGTIPLRDALAFSCNTAFVNATRELPKDALTKAAASLGLGVDYDPAFESYFGAVPPADSNARFAMDSFGQGNVQASPLAMAGVVASVAGGHTVIPWLVDGHQPSPAAEVAPLTADEAKQLQSAMGSVSQYGSTSVVKDQLVGGKTGTAEYGPADDIKTHIWLVGYGKDDVAVAAFSVDGQYGTDLAPVIKKLFS